MSVLASLFTSLDSLLARLAELLAPLFGASATAAAIVLFTLCVRLALHPLARSAAVGRRAQAALAPRVAELRRRHRNDPERLVRATRELHAKAGVSPLAGVLPSLAQLPVLLVMYRLLATGSGGTGLLDHTLLGAELGGRWADVLGEGGVFGVPGLVHLGLFAVAAAAATWTYVRTVRTNAAQPTAGDRAPAVARLLPLLPLLSFGTLVTVAVMPLAAGLYLVTSSVWAAAEQAYLQSSRFLAPPAAAGD
ncbi:hypothetical protein CTZ27_09450 [Streptomyces griseocarneus]|nr:hypothetical protein CTZ27_09450 [Streptomyces griseocarneus]